MNSGRGRLRREYHGTGVITRWGGRKRSRLRPTRSDALCRRRRSTRGRPYLPGQTGIRLRAASSSPAVGRVNAEKRVHTGSRRPVRCWLGGPLATAGSAGPALARVDGISAGGKGETWQVGALAMCAGWRRCSTSHPAQVVGLVPSAPTPRRRNSATCPAVRAEEDGPWAQAVFDTSKGAHPRRVLEGDVERHASKCCPDNIRGPLLHDSFVIVDEGSRCRTQTCCCRASRLGMGCRVASGANPRRRAGEQTCGGDATTWWQR